jgi:Mg-chelatase subunit ChlD
VLAVEADLGRLSGAGLSGQEGRIRLTGREVVLTWEGPADPTQKGKAVFAYLGDQEDPGRPDLVYAPSRAVQDLPPVVLAQPHLLVEPALIDQDKGLWRLKVSLTDERGQPISPAKVRFSATGGSFALGGEVREVDKDLQNGTCEKGWRETDDKQHQITVSYPGDQSGPNRTNQLYAPAQVVLTLPPNLIARSTVFVVDASGSMSGQKLASAKAAVRSALAAYPPDQKDEEWALIVFAGCGNIRLVQPFTTNPGDITSKLTFSAGGSTPIAAAMAKAARYIRRAGRGQEGRIILLSDGGENCHGDPVKAAESIHRRVRTVTPGGRRGRP